MDLHSFYLLDPDLQKMNADPQPVAVSYQLFKCKFCICKMLHRPRIDP